MIISGSARDPRGRGNEVALKSRFHWHDPGLPTLICLLDISRLNYLHFSPEIELCFPSSQGVSWAGDGSTQKKEQGGLKDTVGKSQGMWEDTDFNGFSR